MSSYDQNDKPNYYELLCLEPGASKDDVRKAYRKQALLFHPDKMKPHMKEEASQHFQLISEAYEVLSDDKKRGLYDRYGYEGVKAGGDPNPEPDLSGFFPTAAATTGRTASSRQPFGFGGFDSPFFASFGMPAGAFHDQAFADHHQRHMRNFEQHMGSMFGGMGGGGFPHHGPPHGFPGFMHDPGFFQQQHDAFFRSAFGDVHQQQQYQQQQRQQTRPTLFSTSPFANQTQTQQTQWSGSGTSTNPFTFFGTNGGSSGGGGFATSSSSSSSTSTGGGGGVRTSTKTTTVNGKRTTVTEVTDAQGVTTTTVEKPDGTRETFVNGVAASSIEDRAQPSLEGNARRQPIVILDDDDDDNRRNHDRGTTGSGHRLGSRAEDVDSRRGASDRNRDRRSNPNATATETMLLDDDDDDLLYETLSEQRHRRGRGAAPASEAGRSSRDFSDGAPDLFHPQLGRGHRLGSSSPERSR
ncbi:hypothetical protein BGX33_010787 [Mortierella sp. NVP41]|nr:hypothetical protein BGX33_010787 [Mortierella sp. NVP41]